MGLRGRGDRSGPLRSPHLRVVVAQARFAQELAYYEADKEYLPVEKRAQRCQSLSALLTLALSNRER